MGCICEKNIMEKDQISLKAPQQQNQGCLRLKQNQMEKFSYNILSNADTFEEDFFQPDFQLNVTQTPQTLRQIQQQQGVSSLTIEIPKQEKMNYINNLASLTAKYTSYENQLKTQGKTRIKTESSLRGILKLQKRNVQERSQSSQSDLSQKTVKFSLTSKKRPMRNQIQQQGKQMLKSTKALQMNKKQQRKRSQSTTK